MYTEMTTAKWAEKTPDLYSLCYNQPKFDLSRSESMLVFANGLLLGLSLIMALGPQNIFLIKQGTRKNYPTLSAIVCFLCDAILACASVAGLHELLLAHPALQSWMMWLGALFLLYYATQSLVHAFKKKEKTAGASKHHSRVQIILLALGFSLLNPHAIIDTLVIVGGNSSQFPDNQLEFILGVISASFIWFCSLTLTTRYFSDVLSQGIIWQCIELMSGVLMAYIGVKLIMGNF